MMYKILNKLLGWDYILWADCNRQGTSRIHSDYAGTVWYYVSKRKNIVNAIKDPRGLIWLTCQPSKYLKLRKSK